LDFLADVVVYQNFCAFKREFHDVQTVLMRYLCVKNCLKTPHTAHSSSCSCLPVSQAPRRSDDAECMRP